MKSKTQAYKIWILGLLGCLGLHRKYLNKPNTTIRYVTFGYFFVGSLIDLFLIPKWVLKHNATIELKQTEKELEKLLALKSKFIREHNFESAAWYRDKEVLVRYKIASIKKIIS